MTLQTLRERLWRLLGVNLDAGTGTLFPAFWTASEANSALNDAYREMARASAALEMRQVVAMVAGTATYTLDAASGPVMRATFDDYPVWPFDPTEFDRTDNFWRESTGKVTMFHVNRLSPQKIRVYPIPDTAGDTFALSAELGVIIDMGSTDTFYPVAGEAGTELGTEIDMTVDGTGADFTSELGIVTGITSTAANLEVWSKRIPPLLAVDSDEPELPVYAHLGIAYAAAARLLSNRGEGANPRKAQGYTALYRESLEFLRGCVKRRTHEQAYIKSARSMGSGQAHKRTPWTGANDVAPIPYT